MSDQTDERPHGYLAKLLATGEEVVLIERQHSFVAISLIAPFYVIVFLAGMAAIAMR